MSGGLFAVIMGVFCWVLAGPLLKARGWNPSITWEENIFRVRTFALSIGLLGLALALSEPASTLLPRHVFTSHLAGTAAAFVGAATLTWSVTLLRRRRSPRLLVVLATLAVWPPLLALALLSDESRTHIAAGGVLVGALMSVGAWLALIVRGQNPPSAPLA